jgi:hypothetical protein
MCHSVGCIRHPSESGSRWLSSNHTGSELKIPGSGMVRTTTVPTSTRLIMMRTEPSEHVYQQLAQVKLRIFSPSEAEMSESWKRQSKPLLWRRKVGRCFCPPFSKSARLQHVDVQDVNGLTSWMYASTNDSIVGMHIHIQ